MQLPHDYRKPSKTRLHQLRDHAQTELDRGIHAGRALFPSGFRGLDEVVASIMLPAVLGSATPGGRIRCSGARWRRIRVSLKLARARRARCQIARNSCRCGGFLQAAVKRARRLLARTTRKNMLPAQLDFPAPSSTILSVESLRKSYGEHEVVRGLSFSVRAGECFGLLGPNGAGKTTTLRCCLGLARPDSGNIELVGHAIPKYAREARMFVGVVPQFDNLDGRFTAAENLSVFGRYFGLSRAEAESRVPELLEFAGLSEKISSGIDTLSGGMKRRLTLARALINDPQILFLDEPTTGLDPQARHLVWDRLRKLLSEGTSILLTTHFMEEAERLCDRVAIVDRGVLITEGAPRELIEREVEAVVVEIVGDSLSSWLGQNSNLAARVEMSGETAFCYCHDADPLLAAVAKEPRVRALKRSAGLEDVFLKLTGRDLRD